MKAVAIALTNLRRLLRERSNVFFVLLFPLLVILLLGAQYGRGFSPRVGLLSAGDGPLTAELLATLEERDDFMLERYDDASAMREDVARGRINAAVTVPADYDGALREGRDVSLRYDAKRDLVAFALQDVIGAEIAAQATIVTAARVGADATPSTFEAALAQARAAAADVPGIEVTTRRVGSSDLAEFEALGQFDLGASQQLLLFTFLTSLTAASALIQVRRMGISRRMLSTPTSARTVLLGEAGGRFGVALLQSLYIMGGTALIFGVSWGDPLAAVSIVVLFSLCSAGAAMLIGSLLSNDAQASGIGLILGLGLAAVGGAMLPLDFFSPTLLRIAHITPHAWAMDAFTELVRRGGGMGDILLPIGVLAAMAAALLTLASWRLHRTIVS